MSDAVVQGHEGAVNCIACLQGSKTFVTGAADASVGVWRVEEHSGIRITQAQKICLSPKYFPLAVGVHSLGKEEDSTVLVVGGTKSFIQVFISQDRSCSRFSLKATLTGHEGWIRSVDIVQESASSHSDLLVASASQDKYIRIWRIHQGTDLPRLADTNDPVAGSISKSLSSKVHGFLVAGLDYSLTFEALLLGHEDWVYSARWDSRNGQPRLLSVSADSSLAIWEPEATSGVWVSVTRLGEISVQKGSTTATGSTGGFWTGLWMDDGASVTSLGRTGSWRVWRHDDDHDRWVQALGVSGHVKEVKGLAWSKDGSYLLSTSSDQTTRLHAPWNRGKKRSWQEFARPQIHGYDLNCVDSISNTQFISGADEKLLRVFDQPKATAKLLKSLSGASGAVGHDLPEVASIPVLGLSNKAMETEGTDSIDGEDDNNDSRLTEHMQTMTLSDSDRDQGPPLEDELARHTLWPEREKLYGHGYEISAVAASHDGSLVATACKASSLDHAVIRLYETESWREVQPTLKAHSLTVTCLCFSADDAHLLSVGRDRQWAVFARDGANKNVYSLCASDPKGHSRMVLGAAWAPSAAGLVFATAGRDKQAKLWAAEDGGFKCRASISAAAPVAAVDFHPEARNGCPLLALGTETGQITLAIFDGSLAVTKSIDLAAGLCPALAVIRVTWSPGRQKASSGYYADEDRARSLLAVASDDCSTRILSIADWTAT